MKNLFKISFLVGCILCASFYSFAANPFLPSWEFIPDGEPYVFEDPDHPGKKRVYIYGSHDSLRDAYCGREQVLWSASTDSLNHWRYEGVIFESKTDANGQLLNKDGLGDVLYAPDVCEVTEKDGSKTYYLYPNNQAGGRKNMVAKASRPDGPFVACNWSEENPRRTEGCMDFDPAVFIDDDGRVYGYWGINTSWAAELDPNTMASVKPGTKIIKDMISSKNQEGIFRFFEASSIRKIEGKYVFIYSRWTAEGEFGLPQSNYTLAYAYANAPLGPYTYGGTIIDGRARDTDAAGKAIFTACPNGNTHGSIVEINGQWWVFYHRQTGTDEYSRQAMVAPIHVEVHNGKVLISEGKYNSEGFETQGLDPYKKQEAGIACHYTSPRPAEHHWPRKTFYGSYIASGRADDFVRVEGGSHNPVVNNTDGCVLGYKYFNFNKTKGDKDLRLFLDLVPLGQKGHIDIFIGNPQKDGQKVGRIKISKNLSGSTGKSTGENAGGITGKGARKIDGKYACRSTCKNAGGISSRSTGENADGITGRSTCENSGSGKMVRLSTRVPKIARLSGKHALFLEFHLDATNRTPANTSARTSSNAPALTNSITPTESTSSTELSSPDLAPEKSPTPAPSLCELHYIGFE